MRNPDAEGGDGQRHSRHRVLVAAASIVVRAGLETLLSSSPAIHVVGGSASGSALPHAIADLQPDVVLLEADSSEDLTQVHTVPAFVVLLADEALADAALRAGARALLPSDAAAVEMVAAVEAAAAGLVTVHPDMLATILPPSAATPPSPPHASLSAREVQVLGLLALGLGNKTIAQRLSVSEHTVKFHITSIFTKLNVQSRTEAVTLGIRLGLVML